ncbi:MAG TPA: ORC1-type DNA replication protein [Candidatus Nanoarchaeia archaeon]|nr:ORC1-type DNA replication protein [Candidatus Nanoarchaeia archaeon]
MVQKGLGAFFEGFLKKETVFLDKKALQSAFIPESIEHRDEQIQQIANVLAPSLRLERPSNLFIYGKTGTGKTLTIKYTAEKIKETAVKANVPIRIFYVNCKLKRVADTEYRLIAQLSREYGKEIPSTGLPTDDVYRAFFSLLDREKQLVIIILDEIDQLVKKTGDEILYNLTRINEELKNSQISIVGLSNDLMFIDNIDPRVKSSLSEEEILFPPYNAPQIQDILRKRSGIAFKENVIEQGVIEKCAAYAAREHGDARRALELLRVAGELAERNDAPTISLKHIDDADDKIERDRVTEVCGSQPKQSQVVLYAILSQKRQESINTGEVYESYRNLCERTGLRPLTQRRVSDVIAELDMLGIINVKLISKGRYGRTREISLGVSHILAPKIKSLLEQELSL